MPGSYSLIGPVLTLCGAILVVRPRLFRKFFQVKNASDGFDRQWRWFMLIFALSWTLIFYMSSWGQYSNAAHDLKSGEYAMATGQITDFNPGTSDKGLEQFTVDGQHFSYSEYTTKIGFRQTRAHGGPMHEGLRVRIAHRGPTILRLEIEE